MSLKSKPYFWVECDWPGCGANAQEGSEYAAWGETSAARDSANDAGWWQSEGEALDYCEDHPMAWSSDDDDERPDPPYLLIHDGDEGHEDNAVTLVAAP